MKKPKKASQSFSALTSVCSFRAGVFVAVLLMVGGVTAIAKYESGSQILNSRAEQGTVAAQPARNYVTVDVGGKKLQVNAQALQQGPLTQSQAQQIADALKDNQSSEGLVQVQRPDGAVSIDLQGRFQNIVMAKKNDDGTVSQACVDNAKAASAFLQSDNSISQPESGAGRRAPAKEQ
jgi:hypothetical protein